MKKINIQTLVSKKDFIYLICIAILIIILIFLSVMVGVKDNKLSKFFKGNDFGLFYDNSKKILNGNSDKVYDINSYKNLLLKNNANKLFKPHHPPILYYFYIPFASLPQFWGILISSIFFLSLYIVAVILLIMTFRRLYKFKYLIILFALLFPPFILVLLSGNPSVLWIFILAFAFYLSKRDRAFISGIVLSFFILNPGIYILIFIVLLFSFRPRLFLGLLSGSIILFFLSGIWDLFFLWKEWLKFAYSLKNIFLNIDMLMMSRQYSNRSFFYPMFTGYNIGNIIEYILIRIGMFAIFAPIIYSFFHKKNFSRNSFWLILTIAIVLASPYIYNFDLIILFLPLVIFLNLMLADRVLYKYIILILISFCLGFVVFYILCMFIHIQIFTAVLWFFLINGTLGKRVRHYTPKTFVGYWEDF